MTFTQTTDFPSGSSLRGFLPRPTSYARLVEVFGEPTFRGDLDKVQAEWVLRFADGTIATIYDYKDCVAPEQVTDWHVGGFDGTPALEHVCAALGVLPETFSQRYGG